MLIKRGLLVLKIGSCLTILAVLLHLSLALIEKFMKFPSGEATSHLTLNSTSAKSSKYQVSVSNYIKDSLFIVKVSHDFSQD